MPSGKEEQTGNPKFGRNCESMRKQKKHQKKKRN